MRKRKSKRKKKESNDMKDISHECFILSEEPKKNRLTEITELLRLEHLNTQDRKSVINLISNSQDRFHISGEKLPAICCNIRYRQQMIRQYRFPQIHKEEINRQVEELLKKKKKGAL